LEENEEILDLLASLEPRLGQRVIRARFRSPETLFEELEALELVIDLRQKIRA
jgi:hypothetical protein